MGIAMHSLSDSCTDVSKISIERQGTPYDVSLFAHLRLSRNVKHQTCRQVGQWEGESP